MSPYKKGVPNVRSDLRGNYFARVAGLILHGRSSKRSVTCLLTARRVSSLQVLRHCGLYQLALPPGAVHPSSPRPGQRQAGRFCGPNMAPSGGELAQDCAPRPADLHQPQSRLDVERAADWQSLPLTHHQPFCAESSGQQAPVRLRRGTIIRLFGAL
ncbi:hypothetical protein SKAU_G00401370 [Synaphobranchus kaupii]|uniref:Uncharacterized protein n=1 Tax=Synaphobranchus kaupii TaxID=118154 RepID=A0A9Q1IAE3_SYNKA|nr:hypothetical protein SKAU_G00401370 [Synaphobranchus kaupii]